MEIQNLKTIQGQSCSTSFKEYRLRGMFEINSNIIRSKGWRYHYYDMNAGCGFNETANCIGSPLEFLEAMRRTRNTNFRAHFIDHDAEKILDLEKYVLAGGYDMDSCVFHHGDNSEMVEYITQDGAQFGTILYDPNNNAFPREDMAEIARRFPKLDLCVSYFATAAKRAGCQPDRAWNFMDYLSNLKPHWMVGKPVGKWQNMIFKGFGFRLNSSWKSAGMDWFKAKSGEVNPLVRDWLNRAHYTATEYAQQQPLVQDELQFV